MHHHTTLDIPITEFEENIADEKVSEKTALINYSKGSNQENINFIPSHQCFHIVQLCRNFLFDRTSTSFSEHSGRYSRQKLKKSKMKKQQAFKTSALCVLKLKGT